MNITRKLGDSSFTLAGVMLLLLGPLASSRGQELPWADNRELTADALVEQVLQRHPSLAQMTAAWQAASARYPQVIALEDPMLGTALAPASIGSNDVEFGYRVEIAQMVGGG